MDNLTAQLKIRITPALESALAQAADERMTAPSTLARKILAHRLGLLAYDPLGDGSPRKEAQPCSPA